MDQKLFYAGKITADGDEGAQTFSLVGRKIATFHQVSLETDETTGTFEIRAMPLRGGKLSKIVNVLDASDEEAFTGTFLGFYSSIEVTPVGVAANPYTIHFYGGEA